MNDVFLHWHVPTGTPGPKTYTSSIPQELWDGQKNKNSFMKKLRQGLADFIALTHDYNLAADDITCIVVTHPDQLWNFTP